MWREAKAPNGRIYFYKKSTRETTWTKPAWYIPLGGTAPVSSTGAAGPAATSAATGAAPVTNSTFYFAMEGSSDVHQGRTPTCVAVCVSVLLCSISARPTAFVTNHSSFSPCHYAPHCMTSCFTSHHLLRNFHGNVELASTNICLTDYALFPIPASSSPSTSHYMHNSPIDWIQLERLV
jgi:hypothetical protein